MIVVVFWDILPSCYYEFTVIGTNAIHPNGEIFLYLPISRGIFCPALSTEYLIDLFTKRVAFTPPMPLHFSCCALGLPGAAVFQNPHIRGDPHSVGAVYRAQFVVQAFYNTFYGIYGTIPFFRQFLPG
jgi:hypothetical protein